MKLATYDCDMEDGVVIADKLELRLVESSQKSSITCARFLHRKLCKGVEVF